MRQMILVVLLAGLMACDESPRFDLTQPAPVPPPAEPPPEPPRPTVEEVKEAIWQRVELGPLPLTAEVPPGWEISRLGELVFLEGAMPMADVQVQLASRPALTSEQLELLFEGARRELAEEPAVVHVEHREQHSLTVLERRAVASLPSPEGEALELVNWRINFFVPASGEMFANHELNFIALRLEQYEAERELLERIVRSVRRQ